MPFLLLVNPPKNSSSLELAAVVIVIISLSLALVAFWSFFYLKKKRKNKTTKWTTDKMADITGSEGTTMIEAMKSYCDDQMFKVNKIENSNNNLKKSLLPNWLHDKSELIFPANCIEKSKPLGSGKYGTVYKGQLQQGNVVYANIYFNHI